MFMIFSLRRPDILAEGDLGVQKGLLRWALAAHGALPKSKKKDKTVVEKTNSSGDGTLVTLVQEGNTTPPPEAPNGVPPTPYTPNNPAPVRATLQTPNIPMEQPKVPPTPETPPPNPAAETLQIENGELPQPTPEELLTPPKGRWDAHQVCPLGEGLTIEILKQRLSGKKAK
jgi:DNA-3-methyladenine glycosylase II